METRKLVVSGAEDLKIDVFSVPDKEEDEDTSLHFSNR